MVYYPLVGRVDGSGKIEAMPVLATNKKALFDLEVTERIEAGLVLTGAEVKSAKQGGINLRGSYIQIVSGRPVVLGMRIAPYSKSFDPDYNPERTRYLLLNRREIDHLAGVLSQKGLAIVPLKVYTKNNLIKLELGIGKGRKKHDKRELLKRRAIEKDIAQTMKER